MRGKRPSADRRHERGAVAVLTAMLAVVLVVMLAFVTDFGMTYAQRQALRTGVDSAAQAVVRSAFATQIKNPVRSCTQIKSDDAALSATDPAKASNVALAQVNKNSPLGAPLTSSDLTVALSCTKPGGAACTSATDSPCILQASVSANRSVQRIFGTVVGAGNISIARQATAAMGVRNEALGVMPFAICKYQAQQIINDAALDATNNVPFRAELIALTKVWSGSQTCDGGGGSGNWGWLDLGQGNGNSALGDLISHGGSTTALTLTGNPPTLSLDGTPGNKGNSANVHAGMSSVMDKTVLMPVYDTYSGNGSNASYNVTGFITLKLCGYDKTEKGACYDSSVPMTGDDMQIRFVAYSPIGGDISTVCGIAQACSYDNYVIGLVR